MTQSNLAANAKNEWHDYWANLKEGYDVFEQTRIPPKISVCGKKYAVDSGHLTGGTALAPTITKTCEAEEADVVSGLDSEAGAPAAVKPRVIVHKKDTQRDDGRNVRKAYAAARQVRMAAHAKRMRTTEAGAKIRRQ